MHYSNRNTAISRNRLSDRDMLFDVLTSTKSLAHLYNYAMIESSNYKVRDALKSLQQSEQHLIQSLFDFMQHEGWYSSNSLNQRQRIENTRRQPRYFESQASGRYSYTDQNKSSEFNTRGSNYQPASAATKNRLDDSSKNWQE